MLIEAALASNLRERVKDLSPTQPLASAIRIDPLLRAQDRAIQTEKVPCQSGRLELSRGGLIRFVVNHGDIPISLSIVSPDGKPVLNATATSSEPMLLFFVAPAGGNYGIEAHEIGTRMPELLSCHAIRLRDALPEDQRLLEAAQLINVGTNRAYLELAAELRQAVNTFQAALRLLKRPGAPPEFVEQQVRALIGLGKTLNSLNQPRTALLSLEQALDLAPHTNDRDAAAWALAALAQTYLALGETTKAAKAIELCAEIAKTSDDLSLQARTRQRMAAFYYELNDYRRAEEHGSQALPLFERLRDRRGYADVLVLLGLTASDLSNTERAASLYTQALSTSRAINYRAGVIDALTYSGHLSAKEGRLQEATELYVESEELSRQLGNVLKESWVTSGLAYVYEQSGDADRALEYYQRTLRLRLAAQNLPAEASIYRRLGAAQFSLGQYQEAASFFTKASQLYERLKQWHYLAVTLRDLGSVSEALNDDAKAAAYYTRSKELMGQADDRRGMAYLLVANGRLLERQGKLEVAFQEYTEALRLHREVRDRRGESEALFHLGSVEAKRGHTQESLAHFEGTIRNDDSFRSEIQSQELRASHLADVRKHYESYIDLLMQLHKANPSAGFGIRALETSEQARARALLDSLYVNRYLSPSPGREEAELSAKAIRLKKALSTKAAEKADLIRSGKSAELTRLDEEINELADAYERAESVIRSRRVPNPGVAIALTAREIQAQLLDSDTVLLEYALGNERSYVWAITMKSIDAYELPKRKTIENDARSFYAALSEFARGSNANAGMSPFQRAKATADLTQRSVTLGKILIQPILPKLKNKLVIVVADGALHLVPFGALSVPTDGSQPGQDLGTAAQTTPLTISPPPTPLILRNEVVYLPSASVLSLLRTTDAKRPIASRLLAVLADPVYSSDDPRVQKTSTYQRVAVPRLSGPVNQALRDTGLLSRGEGLPRLVASRWEAEAISSLGGPDALKATDFRANLSTALGPELGQYRLLHFATHGVLDTQRPSLSGIVLSLFNERGEPQPGYLRAIDVLEMKLAAELVTLSSCQTAVGKEFNGEGMVGLARAFMQAGTKRVVASLWKVDDVATSELMTTFYTEMLVNGVRPAAALRAAQVKMSQQKRWQSPYYWAGFVLQGEWK